MVVRIPFTMLVSVPPVQWLSVCFWHSGDECTIQCTMVVSVHLYNGGDGCSVYQMSVDYLYLCYVNYNPYMQF